MTPLPLSGFAASSAGALLITARGEGPGNSRSCVVLTRSIQLIGFM